MKNGFITSIITVSFLAILILLWLSLHKAAINFESSITEPQPLSFVGYFFDNVFEETRRIIGPSTLLFEESNTTFRIVIGDSMAKANFTTSLANYRAYVETNFSSKLHANASFNTTNITDGRYELLIDRFQYTFNYTNSSADSIMFGASSGAAGITNYDINVTVTKSRLARVPFTNNPLGDINVTLIYIDNSGTVTETRTLLSTTLSTSSITYTDNSTVAINIGSSSNPGLLEITDGSASPTFIFVASFPLLNTTRLLANYNALLNYTQGDITRVGYAQR
ncbi:hypothetical protein J4450_00845 [Candidatus Micrarchaeota archaeon]|nr:hypothetical protein [Candidatus Micrarchaeota archaeon]